MKKKGVKDDGEIAKIYRKASQRDIDIWREARDREEPMKVVARELAIKLNLEMKISDIEFQGDASKATFYYTANDRVDFRQLIKDFAREFSIRIEMKQVGFRQEASRLGGVGSCGRELCCSTWLTDFRSVNTSAARYQQLSLNPQKLAGQCGKLKCCLNYELDTYLDALKDLPDLDTKLYTEKGDAYCQKVDIFKGNMWFAYANDTAHWHMIHAEQVKEILELNKRKERAVSLEEYVAEETIQQEEAIEKNFQNAVGQDSLTRFDAPKRKKRPNRKKKPAAANANDSNKPNTPIKAKGGANNANAKGGEGKTSPNNKQGGRNNSNRNKNRNNRNNNNRNAKPGNEDKK